MFVYSDDFGPTRIPAGYQRASSPSSPQTGRSYETNNPFTGNGRANSPPPAVPRHADTYEMQQQPQHESYAVKDLKDTNVYLQEVRESILWSTDMPDDPFMNSMFQVQRLRMEITRVSDLIDNIERIHASQLVSINSEQWDQLSHELERLQGETRKCNAEIKKSLEGRWFADHPQIRSIAEDSCFDRFGKVQCQCAEQWRWTAA